MIEERKRKGGEKGRGEAWDTPPQNKLKTKVLFSMCWSFVRVIQGTFRKDEKDTRKKGEATMATSRQAR